MPRYSSGFLPVLLAAALVACGGDSPTDTPPADLSWTAVAAGKHHTCAIRSDAAAYCWGANQAGQVGVADSIASPTVVDGGRKWKVVAAGERFTCGIGSDGRTYCWGDVQMRFVRMPKPDPLRNDPGFRVLSAGSDHVCGTTTAEEGYCWGSNSRGQLGVGLVGNVLLGNSFDPVRVAGGHRFGALAAFDQHTCGVTTSREPYCWGGGSQDAVAVGAEDVPRRVALPASIESLVVGGTQFRLHWCGASAADVYCWGFNQSGQLGAGLTSSETASYRQPPARVRVPAGVVLHGLTAGGGPWYNGNTGHTCGLSAEGDAYCWGDNRFGQLGDGSTTARPAPALVAGGVRFASLHAGGNHTCGITADGKLYCWGANHFGQLGDATGNRPPYRSSPAAVPVPA